MPLQPSFFKTDFRHQQLVVAFIPLLVWVAGLTIGILFWRTWWGISVGLALLYLGDFVVKRTPRLFYHLAARAMPRPLSGSPGVDYFLFSAEPPETFHQFKVMADDAGFLYVGNGCYRIITLKRDFMVPFADFRCEPFKQSDRTKGLLFRFRDGPSQQPVEFVASVKYFGSDLGIAADAGRRAAWAAEGIAKMKGPCLPDGTATPPTP